MAELTLFFAWNLMKLYHRAAKLRLKGTRRYYRHRDKILADRKAEWNAISPEKRQEKNEIGRRSYARNRFRISKRRSSSEGRERLNQAGRKQHAKKKADPKYRLARWCRKQVQRILKGSPEATSSIALCGCSREQLKMHLEKQFRPGMSWENWGAWHIDHIKPLAGFDLSEKTKACHYTNLQPLWADENLKKGDFGR